jgi:hypothetical protein
MKLWSLPVSCVLTPMGSFRKPCRLQHSFTVFVHFTCSCGKKVLIINAFPSGRA